MIRLRHLAALSLLLGCLPRGNALTGDQDPLRCDEAFDDHTRRAPELDLFEANDPPGVDFIVVNVSDETARHVRFEDARFYDFHDEWYWFRLLNGVSACGSSANPVDGRFESIDAVEAALRTVSELPLDLERVTGGRLYSPGFYELAFRVTPRPYVPGTLFNRQDRWFFELEFVDVVTEADVTAAHATLEATLPAGAKLYWRAVSANQSQLGTTLQQGTGPLRDRVLRLGEEPP